MGNDPKSDSPPVPQPPGAGRGAGTSGGRFKPFFGSARKTLAAIGAAVVGFGGVSAAVFAFGQEIPQVPGVMKGVVTTFHQPRHPGTHVVFVSNDELLAKSYLSRLADSGAMTDYIDTSQIEMLPRLNPDLVMFGSGAAQPEQLQFSPTVLDFLHGDVKLMGIGSLGSSILEQVEPFSPIGFRHAVGVQTSAVTLDARLDKRYLQGLPAGLPFNLYQEDVQTPATGLAVFDEGSLSLLGATGIGELGEPGGCNGHTWPVARQGNDLFWGYSLPGSAFTLQGALLFENIVLATLHDDFQKPLQQEHFKGPGKYPGDALGCLFSTNEYRLPVSATGAIKVVVRSTSEVLLSAAGPLAMDSISVHGISPSLVIPVTAQSVEAGQDWLITLSYSGPMNSRTRIDYDITLSYPIQDSSPGRALLLAILLVLTCMWAVLSIVYIVRHRHFLHPVGGAVGRSWRWRLKRGT
jgi:anthranilate/para-aminobenzoate synthase component II